MMLDALPLSSRRLHRRSLRHGDRTIEKATLFPLFERAGEVRRIMVLAAASPEIRLTPRWAKLPGVPLLGAVRMPAWMELRPIRRTDVADAGKLWHYDPWWLLGEERYAGHWAVEYLKATNCAGKTDPQLAAVYYLRDLSRVQWWQPRKSDDGALHRWSELRLPDKPAGTKRRPQRNTSCRWVLDPVWTSEKLGGMGRAGTRADMSQSR